MFAFSVGSKESACNAGDTGQSVCQEASLEKEKATCSSILAWEILWTEEAGGYSQWDCKESDTPEHEHT